jgi:hypothetical protein
MKLYFSGFMQVFLVSMNTVFISSGMIFPIGICSFVLSFTWTYNVKSVAFGTLDDRITYALGASTGAIFGYLIAKLL